MSCSLAFNGNFAFRFSVFNTLQKCSSLSSLTQLAKAFFRCYYTANKKEPISGLFFISGRRGFSWIIGSSQPFLSLFISFGNKPLQQVAHGDVTRLLRNRRTCQNPPNSIKCFALGVLAILSSVPIKNTHQTMSVFY